METLGDRGPRIHTPGRPLPVTAPLPIVTVRVGRPAAEHPPAKNTTRPHIRCRKILLNCPYKQTRHRVTVRLTPAPGLIMLQYSRYQ